MSTNASNLEQSRGRDRHNNSRNGQNGQNGQRPYRVSHRGQINNSSSVSTQKRIHAIASVEEALDNLSPNDNHENCFICAEPIIYYAVSHCNHRTCHLCSLRLRALYKTRNCVYCKTEQVKVIFTRDPEKLFQDYKETDIPYYDRRLNVFCEDQQIYEDAMIVLSYNCPDKKCTTPYSGWYDLKRHVRRDHKLWLCDVCIRDKKVFVHEHTLFTESELDEHYKKGDEESGFKGHPECKFCKLSFYGEDELYDHCRHSHEQCHVCEAAGIRHEYYQNYSALQRHYRKEHYLCLHRECLERRFVVFRTDIDLRAHEVEIHGSNARRVETNFSYEYPYSRSRGHQRSPERRDGGGGDGVDLSIEQVGRQIRNIAMGESSTTNNNENGVNARIRPPPGFGVLSPDEVAGQSDNSSQSTNIPPPIRVQRPRTEDFPALASTSARVRVAGYNYEGTRSGRSSTPTRPSTSQQSHSEDTNKQRKALVQQPVAEASSSSASSKGKSRVRDDMFPALPVSHNVQNHAFPVLPNNTLNYSQKIKENTTESRYSERIRSFLSNNKSKIDEYHSLLTSYKAETIDASKCIESLSSLFDKNLGKIIPGLVESLDDETKERELLGAWNDYKAAKTFPDLEPSENTSSVHKPHLQNKARVLVIKSSNIRAGGARPSNSNVHAKVAAAALRSSTKTNSNSTASSTTNAWKGSPQPVKSTPQASSSSAGDSSSSTSTTTTGFIKGRPTKLENNVDFPSLPSSSSKPVANNKSEGIAWGNGGAFSSLTLSRYKESEADSDNDLYVDVGNDGKKKKQQKKKQKQVLFHVG